MLIKNNIVDVRIKGEAVENIFFALLNENGVFSQKFDTTSFDGIVFDINNEYFKLGKSPFIVQIKSRGAFVEKHNDNGILKKDIEKIKFKANELNIVESSLYLVHAFYNNGDIRSIVYFIIPFSKLNLFDNGGNQYRFNYKKCCDLVNIEKSIVKF